MIKKSQKSINIENIENKDGGIINFYNDSPIDKNSKKIDIAAVDRYSTPLVANVDMTPFGEKGYFRVATRVTEKLNNQTIYQKYLTFGSEKKAKENFDFIVGVMEGIKDEAEIELRHSAFLIPRIWSKLSNISNDTDIAYHDGEDASIKLRFNNNQFDGKDNPIPGGWIGSEQTPWGTYTQGVVSSNIADIIGAPSQYTNPGRTGVMAKGMNKMIKTSSKQNKILSISSTYKNIFLKYSKKSFSTEEAKEIGEEIGIDWEKVKFSVSDFKKGLEVEVEHDDDPQTDVVRDDKRKYDYVGKIAWRHLKESPRYYKELDKMEKKF